MLIHLFKNQPLRSNLNNQLTKRVTKHHFSKMTNLYQINDDSTNSEYNLHIQQVLQKNKENLESLSHPGSKPVLPFESGPVNPQSPNDTVFFFDIDNCLYKRSTKIHELMQEYIHDYFVRTLNISDQEAYDLQHNYYRTYGLAIQGLVKYHKIDALEYNKKVDDALPLQDILKPDPELRKLLINLRESGTVDRLWLFTNAYKNHAKRVISLLGIGDLFDGLTYCDYGEDSLVCKPMKESFDKAMYEAGVTKYENCYFVDDSSSNIKTAVELGFKKVVLFLERDEDLKNTVEGSLLIRDILELPKVLPELFTKKIEQ